MIEISSLDELSNEEYKKMPTFPIPGGSDGIEIDIKDKIINFELSFLDETFKIIKFHNCIFKKNVILLSSLIHKNFEFIDCEFQKDLILRDLKIKGNARFWVSKFQDNLKINNVRFENLADFYQTTFKNTLILYKVDFFGTTVFTETKFNKSVLFTYTKITDFLLFTRTKFLEGLDLSLALISGNIVYFESEIVSFPDFIIDAKKNNGDYVTAIESDGKIPLTNKIETYRILKKHSKNNDNQILYLDFAKKEIETYSKFLKTKDENYFDSKVIFFFNKISSNHNTSWILGLVFTLTVALITFYFSIINTEEYYFSLNKFLNFEEFKELFTKYLIFLLPTHKFEDIYKCLNPAVVFFNILGRILVGFGIYQTIQAFRKYR